MSVDFGIAYVARRNKKLPFFDLEERHYICELSKINFLASNPKKYPTVVPAKAAMTSRTINIPTGWSMYLEVLKSPATNSRESPGRKNPKNKPVSAKITKSNKAKPPY